MIGAVKIYMTPADADIIRYSLLLFKVAGDQAYDVFTEDARVMAEKVHDAMALAKRRYDFEYVTLDMTYFDMRVVMATMGFLAVRRAGNLPDRGSGQNLYDVTRIIHDVAHQIRSGMAELHNRRYPTNPVSDQDMTERAMEMAEQESAS